MSFMQNRDDVGFIQQIITQVSETYCIDTSRIYVNGLSNGGGMTHRLACEAAELFAAVGMVAGAYNPLPDGCNPSRPVPIIAFHGTDDRIVPYHGGQGGGFDLPDVHSWAAEWAERNECELTSETLSVPLAVDYSALHYSDCADTVEVILYTIHDGGHTWPGGGPQPELFVGKTSQDINASETMWAFFSRYSLDNRID